jgi:DNA-binding GntR family transcriptional regulator
MHEIKPAPSGADVTRVQWLQTVVRERILSGRYPPGAWIREAELQREFELSNGPVREALQGTVADGLAERAPFRGVRVIDLDAREIVELFEVRFALLGFAAEVAAERATAQTAASAEALRERLRQAGDAAEVLFRGDLSQWVFELAGNARLREAYQRPLLQSMVYVTAVQRTQRSRQAVLLAAVNRVIDAVTGGQPVKARRAVRALTLQTLRYVRQEEDIC